MRRQTGRNAGGTQSDLRVARSAVLDVYCDDADLISACAVAGGTQNIFFESSRRAWGLSERCARKSRAEQSCEQNACSHDDCPQLPTGQEPQVSVIARKMQGHRLRVASQPQFHAVRLIEKIRYFSNLRKVH